MDNSIKLNELKEDILKKVEEYFMISQEDGIVVQKPYVKYVWRMWDEKELIAAVSSILDQKIAFGNVGKAFERNFSKFLDTNYSIFVNSGSSANLLAVSALKSNMFNGSIRKKGSKR